jgi:carotenoid cleavage dioxygenase-like enzyme
MTHQTPPGTPGLRFPDILTFRDWFAPVRIEADIVDLEVEGSIPPGLDGAFFRLGADAQYPPMHGEDIYLNGDGMLTRIVFDNGHADLRSRFIRTERFKAERAARRSLFGHYRNPYFDDPSVAGVDRGTANTTVHWHAGKLYALKEDNRPMQVDPITMETIGIEDFGGKLDTVTFTAHPKVDPVTGEMLAFSYNPRGTASRETVIHTISAAGELLRSESFEAPYASMLHDFLISENWIIFTFGPMINDWERVKEGKPFFVWDPSYPSRVALIPRKEGVAGIIWVDCPDTVFETHNLNAFEEDGKLHLDHFIARGGWYVNFPHVSDPNPPEKPPFAERWTFDLNDIAAGYTSQRLFHLPGDMPTVDPRFLLSHCRHRWVGTINKQLGPMLPFGPMGPPFNCLAQIDELTGEHQWFYPGPNAAPEEPVFVPKSPDAPEGDGWLLCCIGRRDLNRSDLVILDSLNIGAGPVATIKIPFRLRYAFHGCFVPAAELA